MSLFRNPILLPNQTSGSYLRSTTRSFIGMNRRSVGELDVVTSRSELLAARDVLVAEPDLVAQPHQRVVLAVHDSFLHRDDGVVGDLDVLGAHLGAALGDVAHP